MAQRGLPKASTSNPSKAIIAREKGKKQTSFNKMPGALSGPEDPNGPGSWRVAEAEWLIKSWGFDTRAPV